MANLLGQSIGRYHILEQLGEGGMAVVYKAYDTHLEREVAIKLIRRDAFPPNRLDRVLKRFEREAKTLARFSHPNIVKVHDYGEHDGSPYLIMEYLLGGTLKQRLGKPIPWREAVRLLAPIVNALEYAHEHNIIHRDIKPSNILLTEKGQPMLTDFGIAKFLDEEGTFDLTGTGAMIGTPEYMAPEQTTANAADHRADIYALGIVFYEMVTGRKPFRADTPMGVLLKHATEPLPRPSQFVSDLPKQVEQVLLKALAKRPADRYQSMAEFANGLEGIVNTREPQKRAAWWLPGLGVGGCVCLLLFFGIGAWILSRSSNVPTLVTSTPFVSANSAEPTQTIESINSKVPPTQAGTPVSTNSAESTQTIESINSKVPPTQAGTPTINQVILWSDDFSSVHWETSTDENSSVKYAGEALQMILYTQNLFIYTRPDNQDYRNVHMEVTVITKGTDSNTAFGLMCGQQASSDQAFYYFAVTPAGQYGIGRSTARRGSGFLTNNKQWATSSLITRDASSYRVGADCGNGTLTLYVDGEVIASVSNTTNTKGGVGIFTWTEEEVTKTKVTFDDFLMTRLPPAKP